MIIVIRIIVIRIRALLYLQYYCYDRAVIHTFRNSGNNDNVGDEKKYLR